MNDPKPSQLDRFKEAARSLDCDDNETRFDRIMKKIVRTLRPKS